MVLYRAIVCLLIALAICACDEPVGPSEEPVPTPGPAAGQASKLAEQEPPSVPDPKTSTPTKPPEQAKPAVASSAPTRSCALRSTLALEDGLQHPSLVAQGAKVALLWQRVEGARALLELARSDGTQVTKEHSLPLDAAFAQSPSVLAAVDGTLEIAVIDGQHTLSLMRVVNGKVTRKRELQKGVDARFAPSLKRAGDVLLVAYTRTVEGAMHTFVAHVTDSKVTMRDVTPISHGAATPSFVLGADEPTLVMIDARAGVSPLLEVSFDAKGNPGSAIVRTPVSQPYTPPLLFAVQLPQGDVQVAYTAIGRAAATAVGIVPLRRPEAPRALLPSLGYGALSLSAAVGERAAVFALESPLSSATAAPRAMVVKVIDQVGEGPSLTLPTAKGSASRPALVAGTPGVFHLLYLDGSQWTLAVLDCDA